jgi:ADP-ribosylglycohydrolase
MNSQWQGRLELPIGHWTDDTEMTLAMLRSIVAQGRYREQSVVRSYLDWANGGQWMIGKNTRALLRGVKTEKGFRSRQRKIFASPISQSNGFLMRASPLSLLDGTDHIIKDVNLTNPAPVCQQVCISYVAGLRSGLAGRTKSQTSRAMFRATDDPIVQELIQNRRGSRTLSADAQNPTAGKGWCLHAFWCASHCLSKYRSFTEAIAWIISENPGSDTDTNAAIAGALLGAHLGYQQMISEPDVAENLAIMMGVKTNRPAAYSPFDLEDLVDQTVAVYQE